MNVISSSDRGSHQRLFRFVVCLLVCLFPGCSAQSSHHSYNNNELQPPPSVDGGGSAAGFIKGHDCPAGCVSCSTLNGCLTCEADHLLHVRWQGMRQTGSCVEQCPPGYFPLRRRKHAKCGKCSISHCELCTNSTTCTKCIETFALYDSQCVDNCPESLPFVSSDRTCVNRLDCEVSDWSVWSSCSRNGLTCGYKHGRQRRHRQITQSPSLAGLQCPVTVEMRRCKIKYRYCEDLLTNKSELSKAINRISREKWLRLLLRNRKRKSTTNDGGGDARRTPRSERRRRRRPVEVADGASSGRQSANRRRGRLVIVN